MSGSRPSTHDWSLLYAQYEADYLPRKIKLKDFCKEKELPYKQTSQAFQKDRLRTTLAVFHDRNKPLLLAAQRMVMKYLAESVNWGDPKGAAEFALKVYEKVSEREEPNPSLTMQQVIELPPLFPASAMAAKAIETLTTIEEVKKGKADE